MNAVYRWVQSNLNWNRLKVLISPGSALGQRVVVGTFWIYVLELLLRGLRVLRTFILARLLVPEDFGIVGIATLATGFLEVFTVTGFDRALIQKKELDHQDLDTAWTISVLRGIGLSAFLFFIAPLVATYYDAPSATAVIRVVGLSFLAKGLNNVGIIYLSKKLRFGQKFLYDLSTALIGFVVTVFLAFKIRNEWALVWGIIAQYTASLIGSYIVDAYKPRFRLNTSRAKELYSFGVWIFASTVTTYLAKQGDSLVVPKVLGVEALGYYSMAFNLAALPAMLVGKISSVLFPAYCNLQENPTRLKEYYLRALRMVAFLAIPACGGIFVLAEPIAHVLGEKWAPIAPILQLLVLSTLLKTVIDTCAVLFNAVGKPNLVFALTFVRATAIGVLVYPFTLNWDLQGTAVAVVLAVVFSIPVLFYGLRKTLRLRVWEYFETLLMPLLATGVMVLFVYLIGLALNQFNILVLIASILLGVATYLGVIYLARNILNYPISADIEQALAAFKGNP